MAILALLSPYNFFSMSSDITSAIKAATASLDGAALTNPTNSASAVLKEGYETLSRTFPASARALLPRISGSPDGSVRMLDRS